MPMLATPTRRLYRGMGTIPVGAPCYDPSHDPGKDHCVNWFSSLFSNTGVYTCNPAEVACSQNGPATVQPLTQPRSTALAPGLPVGYDPNTGLVDPSNTTGATQQGGDIAAAFTPDASSVSNPPWYCTVLGIGCDSSAPPIDWTKYLLIGGGILAAVVFLGAAGGTSFGRIVTRR